MPAFKELPFNARPDLTPYLIHLTKNTKSEDTFSAYENLVSILKTGEVWGSNAKKGFIKGPSKATCFMDVPFSSLKYVLTPENTDPQRPRYEPYGVIVTKQTAYESGCRPVLYLADQEVKTLGIPASEMWRVVRLEVHKRNWISWLHEREWRCKGTFELPGTVHAVLVKNTAEAKRLQNRLADEFDEFQCIPNSIIPLSVMCQGLLS